MTQIQQDDDSVDAKVTHVLNVLKQCFEKNNQKPIEFYRFVLHPSSFTTTVENVFHFSFVIRDGLAAIGKARKQTAKLDLVYCNAL